MNKNIWKSMVLLLAIALAMFSGCSEKSSGIDYSGIEINVDESENAILNLTVPSIGIEIVSQNPFRAQYKSEIGLFTNLYSGLVSYDSDCNIIPELAVSWEASDDYKTWTFHLRDDVYWVNYLGEKQELVTASDFLTGMEWLMNYGKNEGYSLSLAETFIKGAADYLDYTLGLSDEEARSVPRETFLDMVGIKAPDDFTVVYTCTESCPFFLSLAVNFEFLPLSEKHVNELGIDKTIVNSYYDAWFNGPYLMTEFITNNVKILDPNPHWYGNNEHTRFQSVTIRYVESNSVALQLYKTGELDYTELYQSQVKAILSDRDGKYYEKLTAEIPVKYSEQLFFNFYKLDKEGNPDETWNRAAANEAFRFSLYYGLDVYDMLQNGNYLEPLNCETNTLLPKKYIFLSDGTDYTDMVEANLNLPESDGEHLRRLNQELFLKYKAQAIEELSSEGISFPIAVDYYIIASDQAALDNALILKSCFEDSLGSDFVTLNIKTYASSYYREVYRPRVSSFIRDSWGPDYEDPASTLIQFSVENPDFYFVDGLGYAMYSEEELSGEKSYMSDVIDSLKRYSEMVNEACAIHDDRDRRLKAFALAESYYMKNALSIPYRYDRGWTLTKIDLTSLGPGFGHYSSRYVDVKTDKNGYTNAIWEGENE